MQVLSSLKSAKTRHPGCKVVRRHGVVYVICKENPRFKARQGGKKNVKRVFLFLCVTLSLALNYPPMMHCIGGFFILTTRD
ncbi:50S ribosomal protein L36 [Aggregatibacter actinomycetemcomitans NUM4039]|nr:50S ribosomal protein L36 [Aggregatibacter actinomycetemcomitans NUM4039]